MARKLETSGKVKLAAVTGGHPFDVPGFRAMFERMPDVDVYHQDVDNWAYSVITGQFEQYDVFLFYTMVHWGVNSIRPDWDKHINRALERLGESSQGIIVLHHALLNWPKMQLWSDICNVQDRGLRGCVAGERVRCDVASPDHPITRGLGSWEMTDELYIMDLPPAPSQVLVSTENPKSMAALGWAHTYKNARVFCYESGHDDETYTDPSFETVLRRGVQWCAGRI